MTPGVQEGRIRVAGESQPISGRTWAELHHPIKWWNYRALGVGTGRVKSPQSIRVPPGQLSAEAHALFLPTKPFATALAWIDFRSALNTNYLWVHSAIFYPESQRDKRQVVSVFKWSFRGSLNVEIRGRPAGEGFSELICILHHPSLKDPLPVKLPEFSSGIQTKDKVFVIELIIRKEDGFLEQESLLLSWRRDTPKITRGGLFAYEQPLWVQLVLDVGDSETKTDLFLLTGRLRIRCVQLYSVSWNAHSFIQQAVDKPECLKSSESASTGHQIKQRLIGECVQRFGPRQTWAWVCLCSESVWFESPLCLSFSFHKIGTVRTSSWVSCIKWGPFIS